MRHYEKRLCDGSAFFGDTLKQTAEPLQVPAGRHGFQATLPVLHRPAPKVTWIARVNQGHDVIVAHVLMLGGGEAHGAKIEC